MHAENFADVLGKKPVVLLMATPALCQTRVCGPVTDIAAQLQKEYGDRATFIHQEVYEDNDVQKGLREPLRRFGSGPSLGYSPSARTARGGAPRGVIRQQSLPRGRRSGLGLGARADGPASGAVARPLHRPVMERDVKLVGALRLEGRARAGRRRRYPCRNSRRS